MLHIEQPKLVSMPAIIRPKEKRLKPLYSPLLRERWKEKPVQHSVTFLIPEMWVKGVGIYDDEEAERWLLACSYGDPIAIEAMMRIPWGRRSAFTPYDSTYNSGSGTETVSSGATACTLTTFGGGGGGGKGLNDSNAWGGGGAAKCVSTPSVSGGATLGYSVGGGGIGYATAASTGNGTAGTATTTSSGTGGFSGIAHSAGGGGAGTTTSGGAAGAASGGSTNTSGTAGNQVTGGAAASGGGAGGLSAWYTYDTEIGAITDSAEGQPGTAPGGGGGGGIYQVMVGADFHAADGAAGRATFSYT